MSETKGLVLLVGDNDVRLQTVKADFHRAGRACVAAQNIQDIAAACTDPLNQPVVLFSENISVANPEQADLLPILCENYLIVIAVCEEDKPFIADYFRLGAADVMVAGASQIDIVSVLLRVANLADARQHAQTYSSELERTNHELQESLRLLKQDQLAGLEVQKSLMPESPLKFGDYEISHSITPSLYLSGDFVGYNFVLDRYLLFYFADVSGHGASSAFVTVLLRFMIGRVIRRHQLEQDYAALAQAPDGLVEHINSELLATGLGKHLTIVAGSLDTQTNSLRYVVGAQQPQPILITGGKAQYLAGSGKPVGIFEEANWRIEELSLPEDFAFVLLSDGVFDLIPEKDLALKEQKLLSYLEKGSDRIDNLKEKIFVDYVEAPQDDISVLLLSRGMVK
ncbi:MAG: PP2C family protein-serine/threonine phosphatase [Porticoccaceae bacterium]|jgi:serine phosphatase RsbU (regulator of sigma subunit)|nr:PP2C family protein-serine/threonine phosphatase [Porticoccaceae bacterium]MDG1307361.1 PP2C family protein-serine/threonine phosphatase [Porticoccaceae bacterium]